MSKRYSATSIPVWKPLHYLQPKTSLNARLWSGWASGTHIKRVPGTKKWQCLWARDSLFLFSSMRAVKEQWEGNSITRSPTFRKNCLSHTGRSLPHVPNQESLFLLVG